MYREHGEPRIMKRLKFLKKNWKLAGRAFKALPGEEIYHGDWKSLKGRELVEAARKKIGYSNATANCDIFWSMYGLYRWVKDSSFHKTW